MSDSSRGGKPLRSLGRLRLPKIFRRPPSQVAQSASHMSQSTRISTSVPRSTSPNNAPNTRAPIPVSQENSIQATPITESTARSVHPENYLPQDNAYTAIGGLPTTVAVPETRVQRAKEVGSVAYEGVKLTLQALSDTAGMCPPLKTAVAGLLTIIKLVDVCGSMSTLCP